MHISYELLISLVSLGMATYAVFRKPSAAPIAAPAAPKVIAAVITKTEPKAPYWDREKRVVVRESGAK